MAQVNGSNISFSGLKANYVAGGGTDADGNSSLRDNKTNTKINLSYFRNAGFTDGTSVPASGQISLNTNLKSKTFGTSESFTYSWKYYAFGANIGTTYLYWYSGSTLNLLRTISGQQHTESGKSWNSYTEDLSSYSGQTGYIVYAYKTGSSWRNDPQFDEMSIEINGITTDLAPDSGLWLRKTTYTTSLSYTTNTWLSIITGTSAAKIWNLDAGGTPSSLTGTNKDASGSTTGKYLYFEGSFPNYNSSNRYYWFRSKNQFTLGDDDSSDDDSGGGGI
tara:strand:+ start:11 stop:841 length:831 start_codon:yes stop_codon:yes gene_type:complete